MCMPAGPRGRSSKDSDFSFCKDRFKLIFFSLSLSRKVNSVHVIYTSVDSTHVWTKLPMSIPSYNLILFWLTPKGFQCITHVLTTFCLYIRLGPLLGQTLFGSFQVHSHFSVASVCSCHLTWRKLYWKRRIVMCCWNFVLYSSHVHTIEGCRWKQLTTQCAALESWTNSTWVGSN